MKRAVRKEFKGRLPEKLFSGIETLEKSIEKKQIDLPEKRAVFDLDNTLLIGDIGDALFARLKEAEKKESVKIDGTEINFSWSEYRNLIKTGNGEKAYRDVVKSMSG